MKFVSCISSLSGMFMLIPINRIACVKYEGVYDRPSEIVDVDGCLYVAATVNGLKNPKLSNCIVEY